MATFLDTTEVKQLKAGYSDWLSKLKSDEFVHRLFSERLISDYEYQKLMAQGTPQDKNSQIFHDVLMKATYNDICRVRRILLMSQHASHKSLARSLPNRDPNYDYDQYEEDGQVGDVEMEEEDHRDLQDHPHLETLPYASKPNTTPRAGSGKNKKKASLSNAAAKPDYSCYEPMLRCYGVKPGNDPYKGKGMCAIMRNFTHELRGYEADAVSIKQFFGRELGYEIVADNYGLVNMTKAKFEAKLLMIQNMLENKYDRFVLFILSHGDEHGIKMCSPDDPKKEEKDKEGQPVRVTVDYIVELFCHDKVRPLKSFPKCFFIQACQGEQVAAHASSADHSQIERGLEEERARERWQPPTHKLTDKADVLVCLPSQKGTFSWVPSTGSWFIQEAIAVFRKYHRQEHLVDMMVAVNDALSKREGKGRVGSSPVIDVYQMPALTCSLTQKFFLSIPPIKPYSDTGENTQ